MGKAKKGDNVQVHYTGKLDDGTVFDSSEGRDPIAFQLGAGSVIPGFEAAVLGMQVGDQTTTHIPFDQAYGPSDPDRLFTVARSEFPAELDPQVGQQLQLQQQDGQVFVVQIREVSDAAITLDANHPLAGKDLTFDIRLVQLGE